MSDSIIDGGHDAEVKKIVEKYDTESRFRILTGTEGRLVSLWLIAMALFHLYTAGIAILPAIVQNSIHLTFVIVAAFLLYPATKRSSKTKVPWYDFIFALCGGICIGYIAFAFRSIAERGGAIYGYEIWLGVIAILLILEAGRRVLGPVLPTLGIIFLSFCFFGQHLSGIFQIRAYSLARVVEHMYLTSEGIFGAALGASSTFVIAFIIFGAFLNKSGGARFFNELSLALAGSSPGGPAKVAVVASGLLGTINGSSVGNVATTGTFTIPLMKKVGYEPEYAGAVEAAASTGGQLMPPIMGAGAFIMSEFIGMPYVDIALAALCPAMAYYISIFVAVHLHARKVGMRGMDKKDLPSARAVMMKDGHLLIPILVVIISLLLKFSPIKSAFCGIVAIIVVSAVRTHTRMSFKDICEALRDGAQGGIGVAMACAVVGFLIGTSSLTSLGLIISNNIIDISKGSLFFTLILAMISCLLLGMGLPTTANYIVCSTIIAPALTKMGVAHISAHMFVYYFGIMADLTPPVCLAAFTGADIAGANPTKTGFTAVRIVLVAFLLPYAFIYFPEILSIGTPFMDSALITILFIIGACSIEAGLERWCFIKLNLPLSLLMVAFGIGIYLPFQLIHRGSVAAVLLMLLFCYMKKRRGLTGNNETI